MIPLVSLYHATLQVKPADEEDFDLKKELDLASSIVLNYLKLTDLPDGWLAEESPALELDPSDISIIATNDSPILVYRVPGNIQKAVLLILTEGYENRSAGNCNPISQAVVDLLTPFRDPTFA